MVGTQLHAVVRHLRLLASPERVGGLGDGPLLERFLESRDEAAFEVLVWRHGAMVLGVCQRLLHHEQDAEDAFQATFLALLRGAASIGKRESVGSWLCKVAYRLALKAKAGSVKRTLHEKQAAIPRGIEPDPQQPGWELRPVLDEEVNRLPGKYRLPFVLCYVEGRTTTEAARHLGWAPGTVKTRLAWARKRLRTRLVRRGVAVPATLFATALSRELAPAAVPVSWVAGVAQAGWLSLAGQHVAGAVSVRAVALAEGALRALALAKLKGVAALLVTLAALAVGAGWAARQTFRTAPTLPGHREEATPEAQRNPPPNPPPNPPTDRPARTDCYGDPLPPGAHARLGTTRWCLDGYGAHCMVVAQGGNTLLTANPVTGISVWDMATGRVTRQIPADPELRRTCLPGSAVALSADGRTAALAGTDGTVHVLDLDTGKERQRCRGHRGLVQAAALSADGGTLVTRSADGTLRVWDVVLGKQLRQMPLRAHKYEQFRPVELAISPDGRTLAWIGEEQERLVHVCEAATGLERYRLGEHKGLRRRIAFSPDSQKLVSTSDEGPGQVWDVQTGRLVRELPYWNNRWLVPAAFTPDSKALVLTVGADAMRLVDVATGKELWRVARRYVSTVLDVFAFAPDGKTLVVSSSELGQVIHRYDTASGKRLRSPVEPNAEPQALAFAPGERTLYSVGDDGVLSAWEAGTGKEVRRTALGTPVSNTSGLFSPDGRLLALDKEGTTHLYETATGKRLRRLGGGSPRAFSPNGQVLAALGKGGTAVLWEVATGKELRRLPLLAEWGVQISLVTDGQGLVSHTWLDHQQGGLLRLWDVPREGESRCLTLPPHWGTVVLSPDGKTLAVPLSDWKSIDFLEVSTGRKRLQVEPPTQWPCALGFSPDGRLFLVSDANGSVRFLDTDSGRRVLRREGHRGMVTGWTFSPTGRTMVTFSSDRTALVWDMTDLLEAVKVAPVILSPAELRGLWANLADDDVAKAYRALRTLAASPGQTVPFLKQALRPLAATSPEHINRLVSELDSRSFMVRKKAAENLEGLGEAAEPALRRVLEDKPSPEVRRRVEQLLTRLEAPSAELLRALRSIEVLEYTGTAEARTLLETLTRGAPEARLTREAVAARNRLARRPTRSQ